MSNGGASGWPLARLLVGDEDLTMHSRMPGWVATRTARKQDVGQMAVSRHVEVFLPVLAWRRWDVVTFAARASALADIRVLLPRRARIADELRARGYQVTDRR